VALGGPGGGRLTVIRPLRAVLCDQPLPGEEPFLKLLEGALILTVEGYLLRADIVQG